MIDKNVYGQNYANDCFGEDGDKWTQQNVGFIQ